MQRTGGNFGLILRTDRGMREDLENQARLVREESERREQELRRQMERNQAERRRYASCVRCLLFQLENKYLKK